MAIRPLDGFTVGITADRRREEQAELLARRGATVVQGPAISTAYLASDEDLRKATLMLIDDPPDYLVASTGIGMRAWMEAASASGLGDALVGTLRGAKVVARGPKAAGAIEGLGLSVWRRSESERMAEVQSILLDEGLADRTVAVQQHGLPSPGLTSSLRSAGADVVEVPVYRWKMPDDSRAASRLVEDACAGRLDAITFTSAPAVHNLFAIAEANGRSNELLAAFNRGLAAACVGPVCAEAAVEEGIESPVAPSVGRLGLLVRALSDHLAGRRRCFRIGEHELIAQGSVVEIDGDRAELTPLERGVFDLLAARPGVVVPRPTLLAKVWGSADGDPHVLEVTVGRLRRRLGPCGPAIKSVPNRGYRLCLSENRP